jgi:hypothetical protein
LNKFQLEILPPDFIDRKARAHLPYPTTLAVLSRVHSQLNTPDKVLVAKPAQGCEKNRAPNGATERGLFKVECRTRISYSTTPEMLH